MVGQVELFAENKPSTLPIEYPDCSVDSLLQSRGVGLCCRCWVKSLSSERIEVPTLTLLAHIGGRRSSAIGLPVGSTRLMMG